MDFSAKEVLFQLNIIKRLQMEMMTYLLFYQYVIGTGRFTPDEIISQVNKARSSAESQAEGLFSEVLRTLENTPDQEAAQKALKFLAEWQPKGPIH